MATKTKRPRGRPVAEKPLYRTLSVRLGDRLHDAFLARAARERRKPSDLLRLMVEDALILSGDIKPE